MRTIESKTYSMPLPKVGLNATNAVKGRAFLRQIDYNVIMDGHLYLYDTSFPPQRGDKPRMVVFLRAGSHTLCYNNVDFRYGIGYVVGRVQSRTPSITRLNITYG